MKEKSKYYNKKYAHFDMRKNFDDYKSYIQNPKRIKSHGFYPFIRYEINFIKYNKKSNETITKKREISYSAHIDRYIYKYYSEKLNHYYNIKAPKYNINEVSIAYRNNMKGKSSVNFAKEVIDFITTKEKCYILVGDFKDFFNNINHVYLKERICDLLECDKLPDDYYAVYKNITKYSYINIKDIEDILERRRIKLNEKLKDSKLFYTKDFQNLKKNKLKINKTGVGIPQGASISSVYANIYMIEFDNIVNKYVNERNGIYRRYCDDFIVVLPINKELECYRHKKIIFNKIYSIPDLKISESKTKEYIYGDKKLKWEDKESAVLDYLGFEFNGIEVKIREKSVSKFYYRLYRKINKSNRRTKKEERKCLRKSLYRNYSHLGSIPSKKSRGNFITYANKAQRVFDENSSTNNKMNEQIKKHWKVISRELSK